ncbi:MAG: hypothetical protein V7637_3700 [Mycobacteriales bacterium]|jgi:uncharacterized membrane protein
MVGSARARVVVVGLVGLCAGLLTSLLGPWQLGPQLGWEIAATCYVGWEWLIIHRLDAEATARRAGREDPGQATTDLVLLLASVISLGGVGLVVASANKQSGAAAVVQIALALASVVASWAVVHMVFMLRYARLYYLGPDGGVDFNQDERPTYLDFAYLAFTIGMTFQVSDTELTDSQFRSVALRHALLSYLFGAVILASTINLVAGLGR